MTKCCRLLLLTTFAALAAMVKRKHRIAELMESWMVSHENQEQQNEAEMKERMLREWARIATAQNIARGDTPDLERFWPKEGNLPP